MLTFSLRQFELIHLNRCFISVSNDGLSVYQLDSTTVSFWRHSCRVSLQHSAETLSRHGSEVDLLYSFRTVNCVTSFLDYTVAYNSITVEIFHFHELAAGIHFQWSNSATCFISHIFREVPVFCILLIMPNFESTTVSWQYPVGQG